MTRADLLRIAKNAEKAWARRAGALSAWQVRRRNPVASPESRDADRYVAELRALVKGLEAEG